MGASARRQLMKRLITESGCDGENKIISCQTLGVIKTAIDALTLLTSILTFLAALLPVLRALRRLYTWLGRLVAWLERIFDRIGAIEKYLEGIALAIIALGEFFEYLNDLCEKSSSTPGLDTSALNDDLPELIAELSVIAENGGTKA